MPGQWTVSPTQAFVPGAAAHMAAIRRGVRALADRYAPEIEAHMKQTAPWTDQTSNARQSLYTEVTQVTQDMVDIILSHGVNYGVYLELSNASRFAVIAPSIDVFGPRIWRDVQLMLS